MNKVKIGIGLCIILIITIIILLVNINKGNEDMVNTNGNNSIENEIINIDNSRPNIMANGNIVIENKNNISNEENSEVYQNGSFEDETNEIDSTMRRNDIRNLYFSIENSINKYLKYIEVQDKEAVYSILNDNFIKENKLTSSNVLRKIEIKDGFKSFKVKDMYTIERLGSYSNFVKGMVTYTDGQYDEWYGLIDADIDYKYYQITPYSNEEYINAISNNQDIKINDIKRNNYNIMNSSIISDKEMAIKYFDDYKDKMLNDIEEAYKILNEELKEEKFPELSSFSQYVEENKEKIQSATINEFELDSEELSDNYEYRYKYIIKDNNNNTFIITENAIMNYSVKIEE